MRRVFDSKFATALATITAVFLFFVTNASAKSYTFDELKALPHSYAKDYYISRYLSNATEDELQKLRWHITNFSGNIKKKYEKLSKTTLEDICGVEFATMDHECQKMNLTAKNIRALSFESAAKLKESFRYDENLYRFIIGVREKNPAAYFVKTANTDGYFRYAKNLPNDEEFLGFSLPSSFAFKLVKDARFDSFLNTLMVAKERRKFAERFLTFEPSRFSTKSAFWLGVLAVTKEKRAVANKFFRHAAKSSSVFERDNALFWAYLTSGKRDDLKAVAKSENPNIYAIYAREKLGDKRKFNIVHFTSTKKKKNDGFVVGDPFSLVRAQAAFSRADVEGKRAILARFDTRETIGEYSYFAERLGGGKFYFSTPYIELLNGKNVERKALIYALMRQESRFATGAVSPSYALGAMQFMPFLSRDMGKQLGLKDFDEDDVTKPEISLKFANAHLDYLEKFLFNPVLIAYAYNGGIGFTKRMLLSGDLFSPSAFGGRLTRFEPFLSMELVPYEESRTYAKKVLANYVIYLNFLGAKTTSERFLKALMQPKSSDSWRKAQQAKSALR